MGTLRTTSEIEAATEGDDGPVEVAMKYGLAWLIGIPLPLIVPDVRDSPSGHV